MITFITIVIFLFLVAGLVLFSLASKEEKDFGTLAGEKVYQDTAEKPGNVMYAETLPLVGKPDYLVKNEDTLIPVEVKTGKTPQYPYANHVMQLMAYCYIIEENHSRPPGGVIRYPDQEFKIAYTDEAKAAVKKLVEEMVVYKRENKEFNCKHPEHI